MFSLISLLFSVLILSSLICSNLSFYHDNTPCTPVSHCKCEFPDGQGVDLTLLRGSNFSQTVANDSQVLFFPCKDVSILPPNGTNITSNECETGVSLCLQDKKTYQSLGSLMESSFLWERIIEDPIMVYNHKNKTTKILLNCDGNAKEPTLEYVKTPLPGTIYTFRLTSILACVTTVEAEEGSVFSRFCIVLLVLFFVYFFGGFLVLRFIRGARGWEAIPNGEFWRSVISGIKKMCVYLLSGCRHPETYDTI